MGVDAKLGEFQSDDHGFAQGCRVICKFLALGIADAGAVFKVKEISHGARVRPNRPSV